LSLARKYCPDRGGEGFRGLGKVKVSMNETEKGERLVEFTMGIERKSPGCRKKNLVKG